MLVGENVGVEGGDDVIAVLVFEAEFESKPARNTTSIS